MLIKKASDAKKIVPKNSKNKSSLVVISGPSGSGKNAVTNGLLKKLPNSTRLVTCTTRKKRRNEKHGKDYYFISKQEFKKKIKQNDFLEWAIVHKKHYYGNSKKILEKLQKKYKMVIAVIDVQGAETYRKLNIPHISIFINVESKQNLISRIKNRNNNMSKNKLKLRLASAISEIKHAKKYDYQVINHENKLDETIEKVHKIIQKFTRRN